MIKGKGENGFTLIEVMILAAILAIIALIVVPQLKNTYWKKAGNCEKALEIHKKIATDIENLINLFEMQEGEERKKNWKNSRCLNQVKYFLLSFVAVNLPAVLSAGYRPTGQQGRVRDHTRCAGIMLLIYQNLASVLPYNTTDL